VNLQTRTVVLNLEDEALAGVALENLARVLDLLRVHKLVGPEEREPRAAKRPCAA